MQFADELRQLLCHFRHEHVDLAIAPYVLIRSSNDESGLATTTEPVNFNRTAFRNQA